MIRLIEQATGGEWRARLLHPHGATEHLMYAFFRTDAISFCDQALAKSGVQGTPQFAAALRTEKGAVKPIVFCRNPDYQSALLSGEWRLVDRSEPDEPYRAQYSISTFWAAGNPLIAQTLELLHADGRALAEISSRNEPKCSISYTLPPMHETISDFSGNRWDIGILLGWHQLKQGGMEFEAALTIRLHEGNN